MDLLDELKTRVVCGDGAMGTLLLADGVPIGRCFEELCVSEPERIGKIHQAYIAAGARVIKTNTFGANALRLERFGMEGRVSELNRAAVAVAKDAAKNKDVCIAGSVGPLGITSEATVSRGVDPAQCFHEQITALLEAGVDIIFFETFTEVKEIEIALREKHTVSDLPEICSFACKTDGRLRCGTLLIEAFGRVWDLGAKILGVNCMNDPGEMAGLLQRLPAEYPLAVYPTAGSPQLQNGGFHYDVTPQPFAATMRNIVAKGAVLVGGCCGTTPAHIAALRKAIAN
ncbi:MAG: homocysteine S-methyltransferase family protein [Verrucomicrobiota bacterium]|nr:homocysteine S-methyltransferase family protein [Verrucomicrobiota bacterium]